MKVFIIALAAILSFTACSNNFGEKVKNGHVEVYYKEGITKEEAEKTAALLYDSDKAVNNNTTDTKSIQLTKTGDTINFRMVVIKEKLKGMKDEVFLTMGNVFADSVFKGVPVNVDLTDDKFTTVRTIHYKKYDYAGLSTDLYGTKYTSGNVELYAKNFSPDLARQLADLLNEYMQPSTIYSFQASSGDNGSFEVKMVSEEANAKAIADEKLEKIAAKISAEVLSGAPLVFHLTDKKFNSIRSYEYAGAE